MKLTFLCFIYLDLDYCYTSFIYYCVFNSFG